MGFVAGGGVKVGVIEAFGGQVAPDGYLLCDGGAVSRTLYSDLFAVIGTTYGAGDGSTTFNLPNIASGKIIAGDMPVIGNGYPMHLTNKTTSFTISIQNNDNIKTYEPGKVTSNALPTTSSYDSSLGYGTAMGLSPYADKSGAITDLSNCVSTNFIIKY